MKVMPGREDCCRIKSHAKCRSFSLPPFSPASPPVPSSLSMSRQLCVEICQEEMPGFAYFGTQYSIEVKARSAYGLVILSANGLQLHKRWKIDVASLRIDSNSLHPSEQSVEPSCQVLSQPMRGSSKYSPHTRTGSFSRSTVLLRHESPFRLHNGPRRLQLPLRRKRRGDMR